MTKFKGFTLAEVLITLGIIGVVAAMTMPTLINSTQGAQYKTGFKKALTVLSQAVVMNIANATGITSAGTAAAGAQSLWDVFHNRLNIVRESGNGYTTTAGDANQWIIVSNTDKDDYEGFQGNHGGDAFPVLTAGQSWPAETTFLFMNDGITFIFDNRQDTCQKANTNIGVAADNYCYGFIDVNGQKAPNRVVQCDQGSLSGTAGDDDATCTVSSPTDIYPVALYDQSVIPASAASRAVLYNK